MIARFERGPWEWHRSGEQRSPVVSIFGDAPQSMTGGVDAAASRKRRVEVRLSANVA